MAASGSPEMTERTPFRTACASLRRRRRSTRIATTATNEAAATAIQASVTGSRRGGEPRRETDPGLVERLDDHALIGHHRHEVVVPDPARDDVPVQVIGDPRPGRLPEVHAD